MIHTPVLQICGYKNSGKTTLMVQFLSYFVKQHQLQVAALKHDRHGFEWDQKNTDTAKHREAGATLNLIEHDQQVGLLMSQPPKFTLSQWISWLEQLQIYQLYLVEGYKQEDFAKIVLIRSWEDYLELCQLQRTILYLFIHEVDLIRYQQEQVADKCLKSVPGALRGNDQYMLRFLEQWWNREASQDE